MKKLLGLALFAGILYFLWQQYGQTAKPADIQSPPKTAAPKAPPAFPVKALQPRQDSIAAKVEAVGSLIAGESVVIRPEITGRISAIRFQEGDKVKTGNVLIELNADEQKSALTQSQASLQMEQNSFQRIRDMRSRNLASQQQYDETLARLQNAEALLERDKVRLSRTQLSAPFDGILGLRQVSLGDYVSPGQDLVNLESLDPIKLDFQIPEKFAGQVAKGQKLEIRVEAWPDRSFKGEIQAVDPRLEEATRSIKVRGRLQNTDLALKPGMSAWIAVDLGKPRMGLFVPEQALEAKGSSTSVFRIVEGKAVLTPVKTGERRPGWVEITEGVTAKDTVVTDGQIKLRDGMAVMVINQAAP